MEFPLHGILLSNEKEHIIDTHTGGGHGNPLQDACLENPHGQKNLVGYSPQGRKESDTTERLSLHFQSEEVSLSLAVSLKCGIPF